AIPGLPQTPVVRKPVTILVLATALAVAGGAYAWNEIVPGPPMTIAIIPGDDVVVAPTAQFQFASDVRDARNRAVGTKPDWSSEAPIDEHGLYTAPGVAPRTEVAGGLTFTVVCGAYADVWLNGNGLDAASVTRTIDESVVAVEAAFGRTFRHRLNVNVFATKAGFDVGLKQLLRVEPTPYEEGDFIPSAIVAMDWSGDD